MRHFNVVLPGLDRVDELDVPLERYVALPVRIDGKDAIHDLISSSDLRTLISLDLDHSHICPCARRKRRWRRRGRRCARAPSPCARSTAPRRAERSPELKEN